MHAALLYLLVCTTLLPALLVKGCNNCYFVNTIFVSLQAVASCFIHYWCALLLLLQYSGSILRLWLCDLVSHLQEAVIVIPKYVLVIALHSL